MCFHQAAAIEEEGLREQAQGLFSPCAEIAEELHEIALKQEESKNPFLSQAG